MRPSGALAPVAGVGLAAAVHAMPLLTSVAGLRRRLLPALAGVGAPTAVALTFDDGPDPASTPYFLDLLDELAVSATFFLLGRMLVRAPRLGREIAERGHEVALHGWDHRNLLLRTPRATYRDLAAGAGLLTAATGVRPRFWRPPYGVLSAASLLAARRLDLQPVLWTAWGKDWAETATARSVAATVARDLRPGATVLLHDSDCTSSPGSWRPTLDALPEVVARCREAGLTVGPLSRHGLADTRHGLADTRRAA